MDDLGVYPYIFLKLPIRFQISSEHADHMTNMESTCWGQCRWQAVGQEKKEKGKKDKEEKELAELTNSTDGLVILRFICCAKKHKKHV